MSVTVADVKMLAGIHAKFKEIILKHRPGTLDNEMPSLISICAEACIVAVNSSAKEIVASNRASPDGSGPFKID